MYFKVFTLPQYKSKQTSCGLVQDRKDLHKDFPFSSHPVKGHAKHKRPDDQAQCVRPCDILSHQLHICTIL